MAGKKIGYIRVSSFEQNPERQLEGIAINKKFIDKASGKNTARPQLDAMLDYAREGDTIIIHSMDRLARNLDDLRKLVMQLTNQQIRVKFVKEGLTFTGEDSPMWGSKRKPPKFLDTYWPSLKYHVLLTFKWRFLI